MSDSQKLNPELMNRDPATDEEIGIPKHSRRELLGKLRKAAIVIPVATALALKTESAFCS